MYRRILVPLEHSPADEAILRHVRPLAKLSGATLLLLHVADGWVARNIRQLDLRESEEMREDRTYLEQVRSEEHTSELQSQFHLVCRLLLEKKKNNSLAS